ncbi:MAG: DUF4325 domain-containing protein [Planctomycetota bacterium]|nr:MAG: DUF4325 domain-containing protein [Planctomycetota bacterium]
METKEINVARDFSSTPGGRHDKDGPFSGEAFRERFLEPALREGKANLIINLTGTEGYAHSFLEEAFGGLTREFGLKKVENSIDFICDDDPTLIDEIKGIIKSAKN